jgi:hypothetical protein
VFLTDQKLSPAEVKDRLFIARSGDKGSHAPLGATVTGSSPTGTVTWFDGSTLLGSATLVSGSASLTVNFTTPGTHLITLVYSGDSHNTSSSATQTVQVLIPPEQLIPMLRMLLDD